MDEKEKSLASTNINWFPGHMSKSLRQIEDSLKLVDAIIEIVDARAPLSTRNPIITKYNKPRLIILSKKDLAEDKMVNEWVNYYKSSNSLAITLDLNNGFNANLVINSLKELLKEKIEKDLKRGIKNRPIRVLVVGIPNVGKSTFINKISKRKAAGVGNKPGFTKSLQWVNISGLELLDTPGVLWPKFEDKAVGIKLALIGSIKEEILDIDTIADIALNYLIVKHKRELMQRYKLEDINLDDFFEKICIKRGLLLANNEYNINQAKYLLLKELKEGLICKICLESPINDYYNFI